MTTVLALIVARRLWRWPLAAVLALGAVLLIVDVAFFGADLMKLGSGGWFPLALGIAVFTVMAAWWRGRELLLRRLRGEGVELGSFVAALAAHPPMRVPGTALFLTTNAQIVPQALLHNLKHNKVLHERNMVLTVEPLDEPFAEPGERIAIEPLGEDFYRIRMRYGFAEDPDLPARSTPARCAGSASILCKPPSSPAAKASSLASAPAWRAGATTCSPIWRATLCRPRRSSAFRRIA